MTQRTWHFWGLVALVSAIAFLTACGGEEPEVEEIPSVEAQIVLSDELPTVEPTIPPTNTPEPEPSPTLAPTSPPEPTATPEPTEEPEPTAVPTPATQTASESGISFEYSAALGIEEIRFDSIPAQRLGTGFDPLFFTDVPAYGRFDLDTASGEGFLFVQPVRDADGEFFATLPTTERNDLAALEAQIAAEGEGRVDQQNLTYLDFGSGSGLRAISYQYPDEGIFKINNQRVFYFFDGITSDGRYYVRLIYPIDSDRLDDGGELNAAELDAAELDFDGYIEDVLGPLDGLPADAFEPSLALLDDLVASITVDADASSEPAALANPNCTNDATYVADITIPDATVINPGTTFVKTWRVQNSGSCTWNGAYTATFYNGDAFGWEGFVSVDPTAPGETFDLSVELTAPEEPGIYEGRWQLTNEVLATFGLRVFVTIVVPEEPVEATPVPETEEDSGDDGGEDAAATPAPVAEKDCTDDAVFVTDTTIPDGSVINPGVAFEKVWELSNAGSCDWSSAYSAVFVDGDEIGWNGSVTVGDVASGENFELAIQLVAPEEPGIYEGRWQMVNENGEAFGTLVFVTIVVPEEPVEEDAGDG